MAPPLNGSIVERLAWTMASSPSKIFRFPVYQIDFSAVAAGKRLAATKRRVRWYVSVFVMLALGHAPSSPTLFPRRFGFPNLQALNAGRTGTDCRGEEHEIVVIWSITSGKRQVLMDGKEVHYSSSRTSVLDHSWSTRGNHVLKVVCHAAAPMTANPGFRQYDLFIDGQSFFTMPKVYELGVRGVGDRSPVRGYDQPQFAYSPPPRGTDIPAPSSAEEEERALQEAINASLEESRRHFENGKGGQAVPQLTNGGNDTTDLLDFGSEPAPAPDAYGAPPPAYAAAPAPPMYAAAPAPPQQQYAAYGGGASYSQQPPQQPMLALPAVPGQGAPPPGYGQYAPAPVQTSYAPAPPSDASYYSAPAPSTNQFDPSSDDPFAPKPPTHRDIASEILGAYGATSPASMVTNSSVGYETPHYHPGQPLALQDDSSEHHHHQAMNGGLSMNGLVETEEEPLNPFEAALKKLVNVDHIDEPAEEQIKLTMKKQEEAKKGKKGKSQPKPPAASQMVGTGATLSQIASVKGETKPKDGIMNPPPQLFSPNAAMAGALVVHGQGPPALQPQGGGFGVGFGPPQIYGVGGGYGYGQPSPQSNYAGAYPPPQQQNGGGYQYR